MRKPPIPANNRRAFARRATEMGGTLSLDLDGGPAWPVRIVDISLAGMRVAGTLPPISQKEVFLRLAEDSPAICAELLSQDSDALRLKVDIGRLELEELVSNSDLYAAMVLESVSASDDAD